MARGAAGAFHTLDSIHVAGRITGDRLREARSSSEYGETDANIRMAQAGAMFSQFGQSVGQKIGDAAHKAAFGQKNSIGIRKVKIQKVSGKLDNKLWLKVDKELLRLRMSKRITANLQKRMPIKAITTLLINTGTNMMRIERFLDQKTTVTNC